eukprot:11378828-Alexandrium_andersonii.AAC.1
MQEHAEAQKAGKVQATLSKAKADFQPVQVAGPLERVGGIGPCRGAKPEILSRQACFRPIHSGAVH